MKPPLPPKHLAPASTAFWKRLCSEYSFTAAELATLQLACEAFDRTQAARAILAEQGIVTEDRFGAVRTHPCCAIERDSRIGFMRAMRELNLSGDLPAEIRPAPIHGRYVSGE